MILDIPFTSTQVARIKAAIRAVREMPSEPTNAELQAIFAEVVMTEARALVRLAGKAAADATIQPL